MKRFFALAALVLGLASCQTEPEGLDVQMGGEVDTTITVSLPDIETRANSALGAFDNVVESDEYTIRYIFQVFYNGTESQAARQVIYSDNKVVSFPVRLVPGRDYNFVAWADVTTTAGKTLDTIHNLTIDEAAAADFHYNTENLTNIRLNGEWNAMDETRDAFTGHFDTATELTDGFTGASSINIPLTRPFAKLRVITTDMEQLNDLVIVPTTATVEYTKDLYSSFNAFAGAVNTATMTKTHTTFTIKDYTDNVDDKSKVLFTDYFFAANQEEVVNFTLTVYDQDNTIIGKTINFNTPIPARRNYLTTIQGNILTDGNNVKVTIDDDFENADNLEGEPYYYQTISSVAELLAAVDANDGEYILTSDLDVNGVTASTLAATRTTGTGTTINLNGYTITLKTDITIAEGKTLTITDINENGKTGAIVSENGGAIVNNGTLNIEGGNFGEDTIENTQDGNVNITGGTFESDPSDFVDDDYNVVENEDGGYELELKDFIAQIGEVKYRSLQKAFDAVDNGTIQLIGDVTLVKTATLAEGKTATLDLNGKTLAHAEVATKYAINNLGKLTITGNGTVNSRGIYNGYGNGEENVTSATLTIVNGTFNAKGENGGAAVYNYGIANINGGSFTSIGGYSLNSQSGSSMTIAEGVTANNGVYTSGATLTINGGEISGNRSGCHVIYCLNATITINGGKFYNNNSSNSTVFAAGATKITYNGGTYGIKDGRIPGNGNTWTSCLLDSKDSAEAIINGGTYNGGFRVQAGTSMTINGGSFNDCYGSAYNIYGTATVKGGTYTDATAIAFAEKYAAKGYMAVDNGDNTSTVIMPVAKVGATYYEEIDEAIAAWTNNTTLTLMSDVTLPDVITLKSTEHHILDLGTYTMTAAEGKNAIEVTCNGQSSATWALTINADATNPGGITAKGKACIYYSKSGSTKDRPIIRINNGVFTGSYSINSKSNGNTNCPQIWIYGGTFNNNVNLTKNMLRVFGGTFHGWINCTGDTSAYREISGGRFKSWIFMTADALGKFWVGTAKDTYNVGCYVDKEGYLVVGGPVITEAPGENWEKKSYSSWSSYLKYSSAAEYGLYYEK